MEKETKKKSSPRYEFIIPIGDWSGDGHGIKEEFHATAAKPIEAVREAYFAAKEKLPPGLCPEKFCHKYQDSQVPEVVAVAAEARGFSIDIGDFHAGEMAEYVIWYLNQGDPDLDVKPHEAPGLPMLPFYGSDEKKRHISFIGYGLLDD